MRSLFVGAACLLGLLAAKPLSALPPLPYSTAEAREAIEAAIVAGWIGGAEAALLLNLPVASAEQQARNQTDADRARAKALRLLPISCAKDDAGACVIMAMWGPYYRSTPDPRMTRQQAATKAGMLYAELCEAGTSFIFCDELRRLLDRVAKVDKMEPVYATDGLPGVGVRLGRYYAAKCRTSDGTFALASSGNCKEAFGLLDTLAVAEARSLREQLCGQQDAGSCHALGRLHRREVAENAQAAAACDGGVVMGCTKLAAFWVNASWSPEAAANARLWSTKGCTRQEPLSCMVLATVLATSDPLDYAGAADAFGMVCRTYKGPERATACTNEQRIREALARASK